MRNGLLISMLLAGAVAHAASFDCAKAKTPQEKAICASPELSAADDKMAAAYRAVLAAAPPEIISEVRDGQKLWIRKMGEGCPSKGLEPSVELTVCLLADEDSRTKELQHMVLRAGGVTFLWRSVHLTAAADPDAEPLPNRPDSGPGTLEASWPHANANTPEWQAWNTAIEAATYQLAFTQDGGSGPQTGGKIVWEADPDMDIDVTASLGIVNDQLVTASITNNWFGHGAAHHNFNFVQFNWLPKMRRELRAEDIFRPGSGWDQDLQKHCMQALKKQFEGDLETQWAPGDLAKTLHEIVSGPRNWQIDERSLTIVFQPMSISCLACAAEPITISWDDLQPYLQASFVRPR